MKRSLLTRLLYVSSSLGMLLVSLILLNSLGCDYEMRLSSKEADYYAVCRAGKFTVIEREHGSKATWMVTAYQAVLGSQLIFFVTERSQVEAPQTKSPLSDLNKMHGSFTMPLNYGWKKLTPDHIAIFQQSPHPEILQGHFEGSLDFYHRFWPSVPVKTQ
ncbi:hypothetical protein K3H47_00650 [Aeromonas veronii]|uniref:Uncharacterized protein n=1 Tax=Aeromonas veronii AMC34 TaxID=1073383 RepID=K1IPD0_AERVE|nr:MULTISPECIES: hypothetical protein [Aeromonas]EKB20066.1 hypothetical protein HMPREF1168_02014 [Aeromonas veronii AMC34]MCF5762471.1 hypothetical protein [Aeromonas veronii]TNI97404.1 hypothetical protein CF114_13760 [Aeromonas veronii]WDO01059.1 hypothetical protein C3Y05_015535 [Aeromonas allosaccharophila]